MNVLLVFIDGFGLGGKTENNPYHLAKTPFLDELMGGRYLYDCTELIYGEKAVMIPTAADLGVAGIPQSATGQTTLWTGVNAAKEAGRHISAYPTQILRDLINNYSIMKRLAERGKKVTFANAYRDNYFDLVASKKFSHSTSTLIALSSGQPLRMMDDLNNNNAVYQDFTNRMLADLGYNVKLITPEQAGTNLASITQQHDFTLYEYFITDKVGHSGDMAQAIKVYELLDEMLGSCIYQLDLKETVVLITSDHGNIEDLSSKGHTVNKVPTIIIHEDIKSIEISYIKSLVDITPFILDILS